MTRAALRRRWWVVVLCTLAVAGAAYGVGILRSNTSTAESVVIVAGGVITQGPGAVDQAWRLATEYQDVIPQDASIAAAVAREVGSGGRIQASKARFKSALLRVRYVAADEQSALDGVRALTRAVTGSDPVAPSIIPLSLQVVRPAELVSPDGLAPAGFTAEALLTVEMGGGPVGPGYGDQANRLAASYASAMPDDAQVLAFVARRLGVSVDEVEDNVDVTNDTDTAVIRIDYKAGSDEEAERGARAFAEAVSGGTQVSAAIPARSLGLVQVGEASSPSGELAATAPVGAVLGLCLGIVLMLALERADPRIDDEERIGEELRCPVVRITELNSGLAGALVERWRALAGGGRPTVALIPASRTLESAGADLGLYLSTHVGDLENGLDAPPGPLTIVLGRAPGTDASGASVAASSDVVVLVVSEGTRLADVRATRQVLDNFEAPVGWVLLLSRPVRRALDKGVAARERPAEREGAPTV